MIPIIDIFAGPGGLGEGFSNFENSRGHFPFKIALSIEKERFAHETLRLRAFVRQFRGRSLPKEYQLILTGELNWEQLRDAHPTEAGIAETESRCITLGPDPRTLGTVRSLIDAAVGAADRWVLVGGPPCQAYSLVGRSRNSGRNDYDPDEDHRQTLYVEYLQILADHAPTVFVMENVKGLLSAKHREERVFERIREDLSNPAAAIRREGRKARQQGPRYALHSLVVPRKGDDPAPSDFVIRAENFGVPQRRHRIIIVGILEGASLKLGHLQPAFGTSVKSSIGRLPKLRSGLSGQEDSLPAWRAALRSFNGRRWLKSSGDGVRARIEQVIARASRQQLDRGGEYLPQYRDAPILNHATRTHMLSDIARYLFASAFGEIEGRSPSLAEFPRDLLPNHENVAKGVDGSLFADRFRVQVAGASSTTVTSHIAKDGHYFIHYDPEQCRSLTVREAATLQTFPPDYFFCGPRTAQYTQVGNAVPPALATQIAGVIARALRVG